jgi:hypothetical protein
MALFWVTTSGYRDKHDCNDGEAQFIASEIEKILADEKLAGRSLGVVSLLGMEQAKHIDSVVRQYCSAAELHRRRFECGDARTFQGSERDILFLSLVVDSGNCKAISGLKTGAYRIDLVAEGEGDSRLAIECDGDEFHGPERWQHDMMRQRALERAGWTFWRCFASTWTQRKDEVIAELTDRLTGMGIRPMGAVTRVPQLVDKRIWNPAPA